MHRYLGKGYNVVIGNPFTNANDPGFAPEVRQPILRQTFTEGRQCVCGGALVWEGSCVRATCPRTASAPACGVNRVPACSHVWSRAPPRTAPRYDNQYAVPDGMNVIDDASCSYGSTSHTSTSAGKYQQALQTQMSFSASADDWFVKFEFSASADYQSFVSKSEKDNMVQVSATAHCTAYGADLDAFGWTPTFTDEFTGAVRVLGESLAYGEFIKLFGTHYVTGMQMGAWTPPPPGVVA